MTWRRSLTWNVSGNALTEGLVTRIPVFHATMYVRDGREATRFTAFAQNVSPSLEGPATGAGAIDAKLVHWLTLTGQPLTVEENRRARPMTDETVCVSRGSSRRRGSRCSCRCVHDGELTAVLAVGEKVSAQVFEPRRSSCWTRSWPRRPWRWKNARLYEDLQSKMDALQRTQQQLVQSAKLAAIGRGWRRAWRTSSTIRSPSFWVTRSSSATRSIADVVVGQKLEKIELEAVRASKNHARPARTSSRRARAQATSPSRSTRSCRVRSS
jgi:hypothetical protein